MSVSVMLASPAFVPPFFAPETPRLLGICEGRDGIALPSEGRGQRFESSWVRHVFRHFCDAVTNACSRYRSCYAAMLPSRSCGVPSFAPIEARSDETTKVGSARQGESGISANLNPSPPKGPNP